jgi:transcription termination/antitermination protein NusA
VIFRSIKSEEEKRREIEAQMAALTAPGTPLTELIGVGPKTVEKLEAAGITSVEKLADMTPEQLVEIPGIGEKMVEKIHQSVAAYFEALEAQATASPEGTHPVAEVASEAVEGSTEANAEELTGADAIGESVDAAPAAEAGESESADEAAVIENTESTEAATPAPEDDAEKQETSE